MKHRKFEPCEKSKHELVLNIAVAPFVAKASGSSLAFEEAFISVRVVSMESVGRVSFGSSSFRKISNASIEILTAASACSLTLSNAFNNKGKTKVMAC